MEKDERKPIQKRRHKVWKVEKGREGGTNCCKTKGGVIRGGGSKRGARSQQGFGRKGDYRTGGFLWRGVGRG